MSEYTLRIGEREFKAEVREITAEQARILVDGTEYTVDLVELGQRRHVPAPIRPAQVAASALPAPAARPAAAATSGTVVAPLPGLVLDVRVKEGDSVQAGQPVLIMEAMKMENVISAPHNGTVRKVFVVAGDSVGEADPLVEVARPEMTTL